jgi:hypothetical protein
MFSTLSWSTKIFGPKWSENERKEEDGHSASGTDIKMKKVNIIPRLGSLD